MRSDGKQDAISLLKADHREVEGLFKEFEAAESKSEKQSLATRICQALEMHTQIEEQLFYPSFLDATGDQDIYDEALVEHDGAKKLVAEIEASAPGEPQFDAKVSVLSEMIKHHVKEEEGMGGMFSKARKSKMDLGALGAEIAQRKRELERSPSGKGTSSRGRSREPYMGAAAMARSKNNRQQPRRAH
jgi:hypothetical protein